MKKLLWMILCIVLLSGCAEKEMQQQSPLPEGVIGVEWLQDDENDYKLVLGEDGTISYYSPSAGNPYHDFDLCETYAYNAETSKFTFETDSCSMNLIELSEDGKTLQLLVDGEEVTFHQEGQD